MSHDSHCRRPLPCPGGGHRASRWLLALAAMLFAATASAADLQVNPILVEFAPDEQSQALWLTNTGTAPLKAQVRVARWTQQDGRDHLDPTRELVASPAILEVPAGQQQLVRLIRPTPSAVSAEAAYRLTIDELPGADAAARDPGLQFLLRYSVPVFVLAPGSSPLSPSRRTAGDTTPPAPVTLTARLEPQGETSLLQVSNPAHQRVRLSGLAWVDTSGRRTNLAPGLLGYVLAGQTMHWEIPLTAQARAGGGSLTVRFNDDPNEQPLPLDTAGR